MHESGACGFLVTVAKCNTFKTNTDELVWPVGCYWRANDRAVPTE